MNNDAIDFASIKALSFDLDDTLWAIMPIIIRAERRSQAWLIEHYPKTQAFFNDQSTLDLRTEVFAEYPDRQYDLSFLRQECLGRILERCGYDRSGVEGAFDVFKHERNTIELFDDVMPFFDQIGERYKTIALTNGNACLERTPLSGRFDTYLNAISVKSAKPEPAMFERALAEHNLQAHQMLHIGDCLTADVGGAANLGIPTVWVNRFGRTWKEGDARPDLVINTLDQLTWLVSE